MLEFSSVGGEGADVVVGGRCLHTRRGAAEVGGEGADVRARYSRSRGCGSRCMGRDRIGFLREGERWLQGLTC